ncbi:MAG: OmpA family protein [Pseudomonadota bacterium]
MRAVLIAVVFGLLVIGGWSAVTFKAAAIEADIDARAKAALAPFGQHNIVTRSYGRHIHLRGVAEDAADHNRFLAAAQGVYGQAGVVDELALLQIVSPYVMEAFKAPDGVIALRGHAPDEPTRTALLDKARGLASPQAVQDGLKLGSGMPSPDWPGIAADGIEALALLDEGVMRLSDLTGTLKGKANGVGTRDAIRAMLSDAGAGVWEFDIELILPVTAPYTFTAQKSEGGFRWSGHAPDDVIAARLAERAEALAGTGASGEIALAAGMPDDAWPALVESGLGSLALMSTGMLAVSDLDLNLSGTVQTSDDYERLEATLDDSWQLDIEIVDPDPPSRLYVLIDRDGRQAITGRLPEGFKKSHLAAAFTDANIKEIPTDGAGNPASWAGAIDALGVIAPRLRTAEATVTNGTIILTGVVRRDFAASTTRAALNAALPKGWKLEASLSDAPSFPQLTLTKGAEGTTLDGLLPAELSPEDAQKLTGATATSLRTNGEGDAAIWAQGLAAAGSLAQLFDQSVIRLADARISAEGRLAEGQTVDEIQTWMQGRLPDGWKLSLTTEEFPARDGISRFNLDTRSREVFSRGFWLPELFLEATDSSCDFAAQQALGSEKINFVTGSARIDATARRILNRLAAIAIQCVNQEGLKLEIDGHTDNVGDEGTNLALSEKRAKAVYDALVERGVQGEGLTTKGFGAERPLASNDTDEGRARNRRIDFRFTR